MSRVGVIVNPHAGVGGTVALKGSDGVFDEARRRGAVPRAPERAVRALRTLRAIMPDVRVITCSLAMGETEVHAAGLEIDEVVPVAELSTAEDTRRSASLMLEAGIDLLLFVGGDGTATDVYAGVKDRMPVVGVPAGVKMQSGVFAKTPEAAGTLAARYLNGGLQGIAAREVLDLDEVSLRAGVLAPRLNGYMMVPRASTLLQNAKSRTMTENRTRRGLGQAVAATLVPDMLVAVGPGTTAGAVMEYLGLPHTLLGFDLIRDGKLVAADVTSADLLACANDLHLILAPIGGQGFLLGRGNQQLTAAVLRQVGRSRIQIVASPERLAALQSNPLLIDLDDPAVAMGLTGMWRIVSGPGRETIYPVAAS